MVPYIGIHTRPMVDYPFQVIVQFPKENYLSSDTFPSPIELFVTERFRSTIFDLDFSYPEGHAQSISCSYVNPENESKRILFTFLSGVLLTTGISLCLESLRRKMKPLVEKPSNVEKERKENEKNRVSKVGENRKINQINLLIAEHRELVKLYIHESEMSWNSAYFHLVLNLGLISASGVIVSISGPMTLGIISLLSFFGAIMNFLGFFSLSRTDLFRRFYRSKALELEQQMKEKGLGLDTFEALKVTTSNNEALKWYERVRIHKFQKQQVAIIGITWLVVAVLTTIVFLFFMN